MKQTLTLALVALTLTASVQTVEAASAATKFFRKWRHVDAQQQKAWRDGFKKGCDNRGTGEGSCTVGIKKLIIGN